MKDNLLDSHPDGLGKHIQIYELLTSHNDDDLNTKAAGALSIWNLPVIVKRKQNYIVTWYYMVLSSDITCSATSDFDQAYHKTGFLTMDQALYIVNHPSITWWLDEVWSYLGFDKSEITLNLIAHKQA